MMPLGEVLERRAAGQTLQQIATAAGVSRQCIQERLEKAKRWDDPGWRCWRCDKLGVRMMKCRDGSILAFCPQSSCRYAAWLGRAA